MLSPKNGFSWPENREICLSVIDRLVECMKSHHHAVAEHALLVWGEDAMEILIDLDKKTIWLMIIEGLLDNRNHWNGLIRDYNAEAIDIFKLRDPQTFNRIFEEYETRRKQNISKYEAPNNNNTNDIVKQTTNSKQRRMEKWEKIKAMAQQKSGNNNQ